jgi:hypothetical protein
MRVLFTIPHYARPGAISADGRVYASGAADPAPRVRALADCLAALHQLFNAAPCFIHHGTRSAHRAEPADPCSIDVVVCTTGGHHLLDQLPVEPRSFTHHPTDTEPLLLGFACHAVLRDRLGGYDYYCYLEDDLILHDPWFFRKLVWFNRHAGDERLLQPNRYEAGFGYMVPKVYVDGDLDPSVTSMFQNVREGGPLTGEVMGVRVSFERTLNPHSGCFFLNARQMDHWVRQPHFHDHDSRFIGPLETTASLGIMRGFQVYRPAPANADFLEVQHAGIGYLERLCPGEGGA